MAIKSLQKVLEIDSINTEAKDMLNELENN